jgi:hypothetical protein
MGREVCNRAYKCHYRACKVKVNLCLYVIKYHDTGVETTSFLSSVLDAKQCLAPYLGRFILGERVLVPFYRRLIGPQSGLDAVENRKISCTYRESNADSLVDQPVSQSSFLMTAHWATCAVLPTHFHI